MTPERIKELRQLADLGRQQCVVVWPSLIVELLGEIARLQAENERLREENERLQLETPRRIAACIIACEGLSTQALEGGVVGEAVRCCRAYVRFIDGSVNALCGAERHFRAVDRLAADGEPSNP